MNAQTTLAKPARARLTLSGARKPTTPPAQEILPPIAAICHVPSMPQPFPLGQLMRAPENVRHTRIHEGCDELADNVQAYGLLQALIGYIEAGKVEIVGGGRRLQALRIIKSRGLIGDDFQVPVLIRDVEEAIDLSLSENLKQQTMSPVDEFFAFRRLMERGDTSPADLAKRFGFSEKVVKQRLRLAELAKPILDALGARHITFDAAMAYATSQDQVLQVEVFEVQQKRGRKAHDPAGVRHSLRLKGLDTADRLYRFVGAEKYEREGGTYEDDLFVEAGKDRVLAKPFLLETIANTMVDFQAMRLIEDLRRDDRWSPMIAGFVKVPDLRLNSWGTGSRLRPPAGFVLIERQEGEKLWRTVRNNGFACHVVVGINDAGELVAADRYAFVPVAQKTAVEKPSLVEQQETQERSAASQREMEIIRWSRRLALPAFAGTPFEGRTFWPEPFHDRQVRHELDGREGFLVGVMIFAADDEIAGARKAAKAEVERRLSAAPRA